MNRSRWFFHPFFVFIFSILALGLSLFLYIYWYMEVSQGLRKMMDKFDLDKTHVLASDTWLVILVLSILVGLILVGIFIIFVYSQKAFRLFRLQENFINNFTHELKTPVTSLKLYLETFMKHELSRNDQQKYIGYMLQDIVRLSDTINRILNTAKIESKSYDGEFVSSELVSEVKRFCTNNKYLFPGCEIRVCHPPEFKFRYQINQSLFEMLLMNLIVNGMKYNTSDKPEIRIDFAAEKKKIQIRFQDNGIGIEPVELKKVFRKFYQAGNSDDMSAKGSGLGLYLAQNIARIHKGTIFAESRGPGKGTAFTLMLPQNRGIL